MQQFFRGSIFLLLFTSLGTISVQSQDLGISNQNSLGGTNSEYLLDAIPTSDGGFIIAGSTISNHTGVITQENKGDYDYWVCKIDANNNLQWQKSYGGAKFDFLQSVKATNDGGYILAGTSTSGAELDKTSPNHGSSDYWIIKIDSGGGMLWQTTLGGTGLEKVNQITTTADGGYIIAGSSSSKKSKPKEDGTIDKRFKQESCRGALDFWVVKLFSNGTVDWQKTIGGMYTDELKVICPLVNNEYLLGGYSNSPISGEKTTNTIGIGDYWILKINATGDIIWQQTLGGSTDDVLTSLITTQDGGFIVGGNSGAVSNPSANKTSRANKTSSNVKGTDFWVLKLDTNGTTDWQQTYNFGNHDALTSITEDTEGNLLIGGFAQSEASRTATDKGTQKGKGLAVLADKEGINDYIALKIDPKGKELWTQSIGSKGDEVMRKLLPTADGGYLLAGTSNGGKSRDKNSKVGGNDFWVVKLKNQSQLNIEGALGAYPNPTINSTNIAISFPYDFGTATLYDINGRQLQTKELKGEKIIPMQLESLPQGIYLINVKTNNGTNAVKVIKK